MKTIEVRVSKHKIDTHLGGHSVHVGNHTMKALREAGIPVEGAMAITWVSDGELTVTVDDLADELVYTWKGTKPLVIEVPVVEEEGI